MPDPFFLPLHGAGGEPPDWGRGREHADPVLPRQVGNRKRVSRLCVRGVDKSSAESLGILSREDSHINPAGTVLSEDARASVHGRAGCHDIVDKKHLGTGDILAHAEGVGDIAGACLEVEKGLRGGVPDPAEQIGVERTAQCPGHVLRQKCRLIVPPLPEAARMERHGHHVRKPYRVFHFQDPAYHPPCHVGCQTAFILVFQGVDELPGASFKIGHSDGTGKVHVRRRAVPASLPPFDKPPGL